MEASLRQLEARNPTLFAAIVSDAVLDSCGGNTLPIARDKLRRMVQEVAPQLDDEIAAQIGETVSTRTLVHVTAEALL